MTETGQLASALNGDQCVTLAEGDVSSGGRLVMSSCRGGTDAADGPPLQHGWVLQELMGTGCRRAVRRLRQRRRQSAWRSERFRNHPCGAAEAHKNGRLLCHCHRRLKSLGSPDSSSACSGRMCARISRREGSGIWRLSRSFFCTAAASCKQCRRWERKFFLGFGERPLGESARGFDNRFGGNFPCCVD